MKIKISDIVRHVLLAFLAVVWLVPIVWASGDVIQQIYGYEFFYVLPGGVGA